MDQRSKEVRGQGVDREHVIQPIDRFAPRFTWAVDPRVMDDGLERPDRVGLLSECARFIDARQVAGERGSCTGHGSERIVRPIPVAPM
jgi:hypothetical protein